MSYCIFQFGQEKITLNSIGIFPELQAAHIRQLITQQQYALLGHLDLPRTATVKPTQQLQFCQSQR